MKNQKKLAAAAFAVLAIGGLTATAVSAQSYGGDSSSSSTAAEVESTNDGSIVLVQDAETDADAETDGTVDEGRRGRHGRRGGCNLDEAAAAIGIDEADLRAALDEGDTIADVAEANGVDVEVVIDAMVDAKAERIAEKVSEGRITQAEADEKLADAEARISDRVNGVDDEEGAEA